MRKMGFAEAIESALAHAMTEDDRIVVFGEDAHVLRMNLMVRFGDRRVRSAPISESSFLGAAVGAAMAGLRPVVEIMFVDFIAVALDALLNQATKIETFSGGRWKVPMVIRAACGGGYGDAGQHEQSLWGWLAHIPGLSVVVPSNPADAGGLMLTALQHDGPVIYLEHKLLADYWLNAMGGGERNTVSFDIPKAGSAGPVPHSWSPIPLGKAAILREGKDLCIVSLGVSIHRAVEAAEILKSEGITATVVDLRTVSPLDRETVCSAASKSGCLLVVDEDYQNFGLSGELAATILEARVAARYARVCTQETIPYARVLEEQALPSTQRIVVAARTLVEQ